MEIAIYSIFNVARVVAAAPNYTSNAVWQAGKGRDRGRATGGGRDRASVVVGLCSSLSLSAPPFFYVSLF